MSTEEDVVGGYVVPSPFAEEIQTLIDDPEVQAEWRERRAADWADMILEGELLLAWIESLIIK